MSYVLNYYNEENDSTNIFSNSSWSTRENDYHVINNDETGITDDEDASQLTKVISFIWLIFFFCYLERRRRLWLQRAAREERRRARREARRQAAEELKQRLDPKRRSQDVEDAIITVVSTWNK